MEFHVSTTGVDLDKVTANASKALIAAQRKIGKEIAKAGRQAIRADVQARRGSLRFGTNRKTGRRYPLGVKTTITPGLQLTVTFAADPAGFWKIIEYGSRPHDVYPRPGRKALRLFQSDFYAAHVYVAGTVGHPYWAGAEQALDEAVTPIIVAAVDAAFKEAAA